MQGFAHTGVVCKGCMRRGCMCRGHARRVTIDLVGDNREFEV